MQEGERRQIYVPGISGRLSLSSLQNLTCLCIRVFQGPWLNTGFPRARVPPITVYHPHWVSILDAAAVDRTPWCARNASRKESEARRGIPLLFWSDSLLPLPLLPFPPPLSPPASVMYLREIKQSLLLKQGYGHIGLCFPNFNMQEPSGDLVKMQVWIQ